MTTRKKISFSRDTRDSPSKSGVLQLPNRFNDLNDGGKKASTFVKTARHRAWVGY